MKKQLLLLALAIFSLASCKKEYAKFQSTSTERISSKPKAATVNDNSPIILNQQPKNAVEEIPVQFDQVHEGMVASESITVVPDAIITNDATIRNSISISSGLTPAAKASKVKAKVSVMELIKARKELKKTLKADENLKKNEAKGLLATGKSQLVALILVIFVGVLGIHRFYLGYTTYGIIQLLTGGGCGIWALIDLVRIATGDLKPMDGDYDEKL